MVGAVSELSCLLWLPYFVVKILKYCQYSRCEARMALPLSSRLQILHDHIAFLVRNLSWHIQR